MAEYIEREALWKLFKREYELAKPNYKRGWQGALQLLYDAPAADVAPVVHGRWENKYKSGYKPPRGAVCGKCNCWSERRSVYCPNCGAKMEEAR